MERQRGRGLGRAEHNKGKGGAWSVGGAKGKAANKRGRGGRRGGAESGEVANRMAGMRGGGRGLERQRGRGLERGRGLGRAEHNKEKGGAWRVGGAKGKTAANRGRGQCGGGA